MVTTLDGRYERAYDKAKASKHRVWQIGLTAYKVHSESQASVWWTVTVTYRGLDCQCPAGYSNVPCWHAAAVSMRLQREHKSADLSEWFDPNNYTDELDFSGLRPYAPPVAPERTLEPAIERTAPCKLVEMFS